MKNGIRLGLLTIIVIGLGIYLYPMTQPSPNEVIVLKKGDPIVNVLAIDYDGRHPDVTNERLMDGDAYIMLSVSNQGKTPQAYYFGSVNDLEIYDPKRTGYIALDNPAFSDLSVGRFNNSLKTIFYHPFKVSGIGALDLTYKNGKVQAVSAVFSDSSVRTVSTVPVDSQILSSIQLTTGHLDQG